MYGGRKKATDLKADAQRSGGSPKRIEEPPASTFLLIGKNSLVSEALVCGPWAIASPGKSIAQLGCSQVNELPAFIERLGKGFQIGVGAGHAIGVAENTGILGPDSIAPLLMNIVNFALPGRISEAQHLADEVGQAIGLVNDGWRIVAGIEDRSPGGGIFGQVNHPIVSKAIMGDRHRTRKYFFHAKPAT